MSRPVDPVVAAAEAGRVLPQRRRKSRNRHQRRRQQARAPPDDGDVDAYSIATFCRRNDISKPFYFKLRAKGLGPKEIRLGARVLITKEAAEQWRRERAKASKRSSSTAGATASP
jgi:hypothetical protein